MTIIVLATDKLKTELLAQGLAPGYDIEWITEPAQFLQFRDADAFIDLLFDPAADRIKILDELQTGQVLVNAVNNTFQDLPAHWVRINGWPGFLQRTVVEASCKEENRKTHTETILSGFNKKTAWTPDSEGFITAKVIAMIINEAYFALGDEVSSKEDIDTALKLGANYPFGPFEWAQKIGLKNLYELLLKLSVTEERYQPAELLKKEALGK